MSNGKRPKFTFELDPELRSKAEAAAEKLGVSLSQWVRESMQWRLDAPETWFGGAADPEPVDDLPPDPEEMGDGLAEPGLEAERFAATGPVSPGSASPSFEDSARALERVRAMHGAPILCTKTEDCEAMIHFPGCPRSTLKAIG